MFLPPLARRQLLRVGAALCLPLPLRALANPHFDVRSHGAKGDGRSLDTDAINRAIGAAAAAGGGTVVFPAGQYLSFSIRLQSRVILHLGAGATLIGADPAVDKGSYDLAEPNPWDAYQDFGHSHWHNSLIWGENLDDIGITGPGRIYGRGLTHGGPGPRRPFKPGDMPLSLNGADPHNEKVVVKEFGVEMIGKGNKAIGLKNCRNVLLRDFSIFNGGHFALLATGVDHMTIDNLRVDSDRDGFDIDCCRHVRISNCGINTPNDDAICLKSSYALGAPRFTENVTIVNCHVSGFDLGSYLDGTFKRTQQKAPDMDGVTGRIKMGTESNGGFRNITISNCVFERCRGLAIESVDGGVIENITVDNLAMRDLTSAPLFIRLGRRMRAPEGTPIGAIRHINISNVVVHNADARFASSVSGIVGHPVEDIRISNLTVVHRGGGTRADAEREMPDNEASYPEPSMFGVTSAHALFARHVRNLALSQVTVHSMAPDLRPGLVLHHVDGASLERVQLPAGGQRLATRNVKSLSDPGA
ncbi:MAG: glycosyl hydrolase family 28-related protein [Pseudomonadota bacterium]